jgi:hypothetical protein
MPFVFWQGGLFGGLAHAISASIPCQELEVVNVRNKIQGWGAVNWCQAHLSGVTNRNLSEPDL